MLFISPLFHFKSSSSFPWRGSIFFLQFENVFVTSFMRSITRSYKKHGGERNEPRAKILVAFSHIQSKKYFHKLAKRALLKRVMRSVVNKLMSSLEPRSLSNMPNLYRLLKYAPSTSSAFFSHQNISNNTYFQITEKKW